MVRTSPFTAGRLVLSLKLDIPGITGQCSAWSLMKMEKWTKKLEMFGRAMEKNGLIPEKAKNLLGMAQSSMEIQMRSCRSVLEGKAKEEELDLKLYEIEVNLNGCLHLIELRGSQKENPFFN